MNESVDLLPFPGGGPLKGKKRRALSTLCILARAGFALALGLSLITDPAMVLAEFSYRPNPSGQMLIEQLAGVWVTVWGLYTVYIAGLGSVGDKKANAVMNFLGTLACIIIASQTDPEREEPPKRGKAQQPPPSDWNLTQVYVITGVFTLVTDGLTFLLCGAGPTIVTLSNGSFMRLNAAEDSFTDNLLSAQSDGDVTTIKRINSHTQLFSTTAAVDKKRK
jgi:hypothetical protein